MKADRRFSRRAFLLLGGLGLCSCAAKPDEPPPVPPSTQPLASPIEEPGVANFAWVSPELCRGAQPAAAGFRWLKAHGVKTVIDLRGKSHLDDVTASGLKYVHLPANIAKPSDEDIIAFVRVVTDPAAQPVFIHDDHGANRVGLFVAAYRMIEQGWTADDAKDELPRFGFDNYWQDVLVYLNKLDVEKLRDALSNSTAGQGSK